MIFPNKNTDPNLSIINVMYWIINYLVESGASAVDDLRNVLSSKISEDALPLLSPALDVLFLLGKVDYNMDMDVIYLTSMKNDGVEK